MKSCHHYNLGKNINIFSKLKRSNTVRKAIDLLFLMTYIHERLYYIHERLYFPASEKTLKSMKNLSRLRLFLSIFVGESKIDTKR